MRAYPVSPEWIGGNPLANRGNGQTVKRSGGDVVIAQAIPIRIEGVFEPPSQGRSEAWESVGMIEAMSVKEFPFYLIQSRFGSVAGWQSFSRRMTPPQVRTESEETN